MVVFCNVLTDSCFTAIRGNQRNFLAASPFYILFKKNGYNIFQERCIACQQKDELYRITSTELRLCFLNQLSGHRSNICHLLCSLSSSKVNSTIPPPAPNETKDRMGYSANIIMPPKAPQQQQCYFPTKPKGMIGKTW